MIRSKESEFVERFVKDLGGLVARVQRDQLEGALEVLGAAPSPPVPRRARRAAPAPSSTRRGSAPEPRDPAAGRSVGGAEVAAPLVGGDQEPAAGTPEERDHAPSPPRRAATGLTGREATVLDAVRQLARGTAAEIAPRCGLPNGTVYVVLRALLTKGSLAKTDTARGVEYSLVSSGAILPFKRVKTGASMAPASMHPEGTPSATVES